MARQTTAPQDLTPAIAATASDLGVSPAQVTEWLTRAGLLVTRLRHARRDLLDGQIDLRLKKLDVALIDAAWSATEHGQTKKLDAVALMSALDLSNSPAMAIEALIAWGYVKLAERLAPRGDEIARLWTAWREKAPGAKAGTSRVGKWVALGKLTDLDARTLKRLWQRER